MSTPSNDKIRALCNEAINEARRYKRIHPDAFQVWASSERKGAAKLARRILKRLR